MRRYAATLLALLAVAFAAPTDAWAQETQMPEPLEIGAEAPDFALPGATRYGILREPVRLSDFKGKTVVLAFFYKAGTKG